MTSVSLFFLAQCHTKITHMIQALSEANTCFNAIVLSQSTIDPGGE